MPNHYFSQNGLTACCTDTTITLFWEKPATAKAVETYTVLRNDAAIDTTTKTHFTLKHLHPVAGRWYRGTDRPHHAHQAETGCDRCALLCGGRWQDHEYRRIAESH